MTRAVLAVLIALLGQPVYAADEVDIEKVLREAENARLGQTAEAKATMVVVTPRWTREMTFRFWSDEAADKSFIRILSPKKDRGTGFLRDGNTLWTYLPRVERVTRIPPSMMLQSWMGSDFTNDDLARDSSLLDDYTARYLGAKEIDGFQTYGAELIPREEAPVVWSKVEAWIVQESFAPLLYLYYDEPEPGKFELMRRMKFTDIREEAGRPVPYAWTLEPLEKEGHTTSMRFVELTIDQPIEDGVFTQSNLKRAEAVR